MTWQSVYNQQRVNVKTALNLLLSCNATFLVLISTQLFDRMCMALGGRAAEAKIFRRVTTGMMSDTVASYYMPRLQSFCTYFYFPMGERDVHGSTRRFRLLLSNQKIARQLHVS